MPLTKDFVFGDTTVRYQIAEDTGQVALQLLPTNMADQVVTNHPVNSLVQIKLLGDGYPGGFAQGRTMRGGPSINRFRAIEPQIQQDEILTTLTSEAGLRLEHRLQWIDGSAEISTTFVNGSDHPVTLEMLSSFSLAGITPFAKGDGTGRLQAHRFRSVWSAEGRQETTSLETLHLERSWSGSGAFSERFGQVGSMPVRGWFPFVALEDTVAGVTWGAQIAWAGSWQLEVFRQDEKVSLSGGLADREFGHWMKTVPPGESFTTPTAIVACVKGSLDDLCDRLLATNDRFVDRQPKGDQDLPVIFNEWCTTWGNPEHERIEKIAKRLQGSDVRYLVIDAGWYKGETGDWSNAHGDWIPSAKLFPHGLAATAALIRDHGLIPGIWFEMEVVGEASAAYHLTDHLLKRDGIPITVGSRRFWDMNDPFVQDYLAEKVIDLIRSCGFGYLKVDYNETIGIGCDFDSKASCSVNVPDTLSPPSPKGEGAVCQHSKLGGMAKSPHSDRLSAESATSYSEGRSPGTEKPEPASPEQRARDLDSRSSSSVNVSDTLSPPSPKGEGAIPSLGEGLRRQIKGTHNFFDRIRRELPDLVIENCASGGHRLEPSMLRRTAMSSFSDSHESVEIPIIAANLNRLVLPRQSQIWAVLHASDSPKRLVYSLAATFLGRMCLSGDVEQLDHTQWQIVQDAIRLYGLASPIIKHGISRRYSAMGESWRHPSGWQAVTRASGDQMLVVIHVFSNPPSQVQVPVPNGMQITESFSSSPIFPTMNGGQMTVTLEGEFSAAVILLRRAPSGENA